MTIAGNRQYGGTATAAVLGISAGGVVLVLLPEVKLPRRRGLRSREQLFLFVAALPPRFEHRLCFRRETMARLLLLLLLLLIVHVNKKNEL